MVEEQFGKVIMFYISSRGHSASGWISKALCKHKDLICFHGTRSIPPYATGVKDLTEEKFVQSLEIMEQNTHYEKIFGACHGFYGTSLKILMESKNGQFFSIIRNPLLRTNSLFSEAIPRIIKSNYNQIILEKDLYNFLQENKDNLNFSFKKNNSKRTNIDIFKKVINKIDVKNNNKIFDEIVRVFINCCNETFNYDYDTFKFCTNSQIIQMEEIVSSKKYFKDNLLDKIVKDSSDSFLDEIFSDKNHINKHSSIKHKNPIKIFELWPKSFQDYFKEKLQDDFLIKNYNNMNYHLP